MEIDFGLLESHFLIRDLAECFLESVPTAGMNKKPKNRNTGVTNIQITRLFL